MNPTPHICVCVCTFKRPALLGRLIETLRQQVTDGKFSYSVVVVDNDSGGSARQTVMEAAREDALRVCYDIEPQRSISLARNRSIQNAQGELIALVDDDEFPEQNWLLNLFNTLLQTGADAVLGPVKPCFSDNSPAWLVKSGLLDRSSFATGEVIKDPRHTRTGNVLIWKRVFTECNDLFDPKYGTTGGGDVVFFKKIMEQGKRIVWCDDAPVYEFVPPERMQRLYYIKRAFTRGMTEAWSTRVFSVGTIKSLIAVPLYACALPICFFLGEHLFIRYLVKGCDHLSKLLAYVGIKLVHQRPYAQLL